MRDLTYFAGRVVPNKKLTVMSATIFSILSTLPEDPFAKLAELCKPKPTKRFIYGDLWSAYQRI